MNQTIWVQRYNGPEKGELLLTVGAFCVVKIASTDQPCVIEQSRSFQSESECYFAFARSKLVQANNAIAEAITWNTAGEKARKEALATKATVQSDAK